MDRTCLRIAALALAPLLGSCGPKSLFPYTAVPGPNHPGIPALDAPAEVRRADPVPTQAEFRNVDFGFDQDLVLRIRHLRGALRGKDDGPVVFDDPTSFTMEIADAEASMGARDLTSLMRRYVFGYEGAPIRELQVVPEDGRLRQTGILHKVIDIPFEMVATVALTDDGWIRIHPTDMKIFGGVPGLGFMEALGIELDDLIDLDGAPPGIRVEDNDLLLDALAVLPAPKTRGRLRAVRSEAGAMVLELGPAAGASAQAGAVPAMPLPDAPNYMFFWGGVLHFGKLFMPEADMQVVDESPADPFDFFLDQYNDQLVAGFTHNRPDYGLEVHMIDYDELPSDARGKTRASDESR